MCLPRWPEASSEARWWRWRRWWVWCNPPRGEWCESPSRTSNETCSGSKLLICSDTERPWWLLGVVCGVLCLVLSTSPASSANRRRAWPPRVGDSGLPSASAEAPRKGEASPIRSSLPRLSRRAAAMVGVPPPSPLQPPPSPPFMLSRRLVAGCAPGGAGPSSALLSGEPLLEVPSTEPLLELLTSSFSAAANMQAAYR